MLAPKNIREKIASANKRGAKILMLSGLDEARAPTSISGVRQPNIPATSDPEVAISVASRGLIIREITPAMIQIAAVIA